MTALKIFGKTEKQKVEAASKSASGAFGQIVRPHITEKATALGEKNQYVFVVSHGAHKSGVAQSVEKMYGVDVEKVRMINVHSKAMRLGRVQGKKKGYKKAIVQVKAGQKIEILPT